MPDASVAAPRRRRSSVQVTLVLIGAASLGGCGEPAHDQVAQRDIYEHRSHCVQDWGDGSKCEVVTEGANRGYWYGPSYTGVRYAPGSTSTRIGTAITRPGGSTAGSTSAASSSHVTRSGFGSSSSVHASSSGS